MTAAIDSRYSEALITPRKRELFAQKISVSSDGCWIWTAATRKGYGLFSLGTGRNVQAHRVSYIIARGPVPPGLVLDHLCRNRACVNPDHLEAVPELTNSSRGLKGELLTHCKNGHALTGPNLYSTAYDQARPGQRRCKACARERANRAYTRKKDES